MDPYGPEVEGTERECWHREQRTARWVARDRTLDAEMTIPVHFTRVLRWWDWMERTGVVVRFPRRRIWMVLP